MDAAMGVAHKAASNGVVQDNSHNVIQTVTNLDNLGSNAAIGTTLSAVTISKFMSPLLGKARLLRLGQG